MNYRQYLIHSNIVVQLIFVVYLIVRIVKIVRRHKINWHHEIFGILLVAYISELISVTLFPVWVDIGSNLSILPISYETRNYDICEFKSI